MQNVSDMNFILTELQATHSKRAVPMNFGLHTDRRYQEPRFHMVSPRARNLKALNMVDLEERCHQLPRVFCSVLCFTYPRSINDDRFPERIPKVTPDDKRVH